MIQNLVSVFSFLAAAASAFAAYFWFRASLVPAPPAMLHGSAAWASRTQPGRPNASVDASQVVEYARESGRRNKVAALWSMAAAIFAGLAAALGAYASWKGCGHPSP